MELNERQDAPLTEEIAAYLLDAMMRAAFPGEDYRFVARTTTPTDNGTSGVEAIATLELPGIVAFDAAILPGLTVHDFIVAAAAEVAALRKDYASELHRLARLLEEDPA